MIPKKIHYCWFGNNEKPAKAKKCIESWKRICPTYQIIEWNESNLIYDRKGPQLDWTPPLVDCSRDKELQASGPTSSGRLSDKPVAACV